MEMAWLVLGAASGVEGQTQRGWGLKARLGSLLNQLFVFCVALWVLEGPIAQSCHSSTEQL